MAEAMWRDAIAEGRLGPRRDDRGDVVGREAATPAADPERVGLVGAPEHRADLPQEPLQKRDDFSGHRHLGWPARLHVRAVENQPPLVAYSLQLLPDSDVRECPAADRT